jgi:hypothetical protein
MTLTNFPLKDQFMALFATLVSIRWFLVDSKGKSSHSAITAAPFPAFGLAHWKTTQRATPAITQEWLLLASFQLGPAPSSVLRLQQGPIKA